MYTFVTTGYGIYGKYDFYVLDCVYLLLSIANILLQNDINALGVYSK